MPLLRRHLDRSSNGLGASQPSPVQPNGFLDVWSPQWVRGGQFGPPGGVTPRARGAEYTIMAVFKCDMRHFRHFLGVADLEVLFIAVPDRVLASARSRTPLPHGWLRDSSIQKGRSGSLEALALGLM